MAQSTATWFARASAIVRRFSFDCRPARSRRIPSYSSRIPATNASRRSRLDERAGHAHGARRIGDVDDRPRVGRRDLHRGVGPRRRRAADQERAS